MALPPTVPGSKRHDRTALIASLSSPGSRPRRTETLVGTPLAEIRMNSTTVPCICAERAASVYRGATFLLIRRATAKGSGDPGVKARTWGSPLTECRAAKRRQSRRDRTQLRLRPWCRCGFRGSRHGAPFPDHRLPSRIDAESELDGSGLSVDGPGLDALKWAGGIGKARPASAGGDDAD